MSKNRLLDTISPNDPMVMIARFCLGRFQNANELDQLATFITSRRRDIKEHGLTAYFLITLLEQAPSVFDEQLLLDIKRYLKSVTASNLRSKNQLLSLCKELNKNDIEYLVSKGAIWSHQYYDDPRYRPFTDIDILVKDHDDHFHYTLANIGYDDIQMSAAPLVNAQYVARDSKGHLILIDAHIDLTNATLLRPVIATDRLIRQRAYFDLNGTSIPVLPAEDAFFHSVIHRCAHNADEDRLIWLIDMVMLSREWTNKTWQTNRAKAYEIGIGQLVDYHIELLMRLDLIDLLELTPIKMTEPRREALTIELYKAKSGYSAFSSLMANLKGLEGIGDKWRYTMQMAFPSSEFMRREYGTRGIFSLIVAYIKRLVKAPFR